jgi:hypothetical protein
MMTIFLKNPGKKLLLCMTVSLLSVAQTTLSAYCETPQSTTEETSGNIALSVPPSTGEPHSSTLLNGSIHKTDINLPPTTESTTDKSALSGDAKKTDAGETEPTGGEKSNTYKLAVQKLGSGVKLSAEDYRNLNVGIVGMESTRTFFTNKFKVIRIVKGSPADLAGIKLGDTFMKDDSIDDSKIKDPTVPAYVFSCGLAGEEKDLTLQRHGKTLHFHVVKMNMEDLPELKDRQEMEDLVRQTGYPAHEAPVVVHQTEAEAQEAARAESKARKLSIIKLLIGF